MENKIFTRKDDMYKFEDQADKMLSQSLSYNNQSILISRSGNANGSSYDRQETEYMDVYKEILETIPQLRAAFRKKASAACKEGYKLSWSKSSYLKKLSNLLKFTLPQSKLKRIFQQQFSFGNAYFEIRGNEPFKRYIRELSQDMIHYDFEKNVYVYENNITGKTERLNPRKVVHFRNSFEGQASFFYGRSYLRTLVDILNGYNVLQSYTPMVIKTFLKPFLYGKLSEQGIDDEETLRAVYDALVDLRKTGIAVGTNDLDLKIEQFHNIGESGIEYLKFLIGILAVSTDIPPMFLGDLTTTEASARVLQNTYYDDIESNQRGQEEVINNKLLPLLVLTEEEINSLPTDEFNNFILIDYFNDKLPYLEFNEPIRMAKSERIKMLKDLYSGDNKILTYDEARKFIDLPKIEHDNLIERGDFKTINSIQNLLERGGIDFKEAQGIIGIKQVGAVVSPNTKYQVDGQVKMNTNKIEFEKEKLEKESKQSSQIPENDTEDAEE